MTLHAIGSAEQGIHAKSGGVYAPGAAASIVSSPALSGTYSYEIDPVNGNVTLETYGWSVLLPKPDYCLVSFLFRNAADFDVNITVAVLGGEGTTDDLVRQITLTNGEALSIFDKDDDQVGASIDSVIKVNTTYRMHWLYDQRNPSVTRDILNVYKPAASVTDTTIAFVDGGGGADTITDSNSGLGVFTAGDIITVSGSTSNDGTYTIVSVVAGTITLATGTLTTESAGASVTVAHAAQWYELIDVTSHGDAIADGTEQLTFGTFYGKGLPTTGGPFYVDNMCLQDIEGSPNTTPLGSIEAKLKMPSANGTDGDFNTGSGGGSHPDWQLVDEIPGDEVTTYDEGDVDEDFQSYAIANADGGDDVLAVQVVGQGKQENSGTGGLRSYVHDGTTRAFVTSLDFGFGTTGWTRITPPTNSLGTYNQINGVNLSESLFNTLEAGLRIAALGSGVKIRLSQIGLEYAIEGPVALPSGFPTGAPTSGDIRQTVYY